MVKPVRAAIVGCGMISDIYLKNVRSRFSILDIVGCADQLPDRAAARAKAYGISAMTLHEILIDPSIELVINLTTPAAHYPVIKALIEAGKHVYTEKILALTFAQAQELCRLADARGVLLCSAPDTFLGSALQTARFVVDSGMIGDVTGTVCVLSRDNRVGAEFIPYLAQEGGGIGFDVGIYYMTALCALVGPVASVAGFMATRDAERRHFLPGKPDCGEAYRVMNENLMSGALLYRSGAMGTVLFNAECIMDKRPTLTLYGTQGIAHLADPDQFGGAVSVSLRGQPEPFVMPENHGFRDNSRGVGAAEMAWALRGRRKPRVAKELALHALEALNGIARSSETGRRYDLTTTCERPEPLPRGFGRESGFGDFTIDEEAALMR